MKLHLLSAIISLLIPVTVVAASTETQTLLSANQTSEPEGMVFIKGGTFLMGTDDGFPFEGPVHEVKVDSFWIDKHEVTVAQFEEFVNATKYVTEAETIGWSGVFDVSKGEWTVSNGANWKHPEGPESTAIPSEPVVHVSYADIQAYVKWAGKRLPTEAEWEYAARGGLKSAKFPWGDELRPGGNAVANWWQGVFPTDNTEEDGFLRRAPVCSFAPNGYGLCDMAGNVWEWVADWYDPDYYRSGENDNPKGPATGTERVLKGGAWLCSINYCQGYRVASRNKTAPDSGLNNTGFRCARDQ